MVESITQTGTVTVVIAGLALRDRAGGCMAGYPDSSSIEALYVHIHRLLDEHVSVHLTTYHVDCTQRRVYQVCIARAIVSGADCLLMSRHLLVVSCRSA